MNRAGQHHAPKARHTLFALLRPDALRDDDNTEFLDMLNRSQRTIFQICLHYTDRSPDAIRDLYQEIVCNLWESWPNFRGDSNTDTWVRRVALNVAVTEIRRHARQPRFVPLEDWMYDTISEEIDKAPPDYFRLISALSATSPKLSPPPKPPSNNASTASANTSTNSNNNIIIMKNNLHDLQDFAGVSEQEIVFDDLQPLFDDHSRRLADILDCPAARPTFLNISDAPTFRFRMVRAWGILALLCLVATISWA